MKDLIHKLPSKPRPNIYKPELAKIIRIKPQAEDHHLFQFRFRDEKLNESFDYIPGQFCMLSVLGVGEMPISISSTPTRKGSIEMCIRRVGRVTNALYKLKTEDTVGLRGPYGNGFPVEELKDKHLLFVAGGLGIVPLRSLLNYTIDLRDHFGDIILLYGTKSPAEFLFEQELRDLKLRDDIQALFTVDDPQVDNGRKEWDGHVGVVTTLFDRFEIDSSNAYAMICGPPVMYRFVTKILIDLGFDKDQILINLERRMKCGVGKCAHCSIGYKYTCIDGPVFTYWDAINLPEMI